MRKRILDASINTFSIPGDSLLSKNVRAQIDASRSPLKTYRAIRIAFSNDRFAYACEHAEKSVECPTLGHLRAALAGHQAVGITSISAHIHMRAGWERGTRDDSYQDARLQSLPRRGSDPNRSTFVNQEVLRRPLMNAVPIREFRSSCCRAKRLSVFDLTHLVAKHVLSHRLIGEPFEMETGIAHPTTTIFQVGGPSSSPFGVSDLVFSAASTSFQAYDAAFQLNSIQNNTQLHHEMNEHFDEWKKGFLCGFAASRILSLT